MSGRSEIGGRLLGLRQGSTRLVRGVLGGRGTSFAFAQTLLTQFLVLALNVGTGIITARLLGPEGRGAFGAITLWPTFLSTMIIGGLPLAQVYYMRNAKPEEQAEVLGASILLAFVLGIIGAVAAVVAIPMAMSGHYPAEVVALAPYAAVVTVMSFFAVLLKNSFTALDRFGSFNTMSWLDPALYLVFLVAAALAIGLTPAVSAFAMWSSTAVCLCVIAYKLWRILPPRFSHPGRWLPGLLSYTVRAVGIGTLGSLTFYLDRLFLVAVISPEEFGLYLVAFSLSRLLMVLQTAASAVMLPAMAGKSPEEASALHDRTFRLMLVAVILAGIVVWVLGGPALSLLYGKEFGAAHALFLVLVVEEAFSALAQVSSQLYLAMGRPGYVSIAQVAAFATLGLGLFLLVPVMGAMGAAVAATMSSLVRMIMMLAGMPRVLGLHRPRLSVLPAELLGYARKFARS